MTAVSRMSGGSLTSILFAICIPVTATANGPWNIPEHCNPLPAPGMSWCPTPPPDVADREDPAELATWGIYDHPDKKTDPEGYKAWHYRHFEVKLVDPKLISPNDPHFNELPGIPLPPTRPPSGRHGPASPSGTNDPGPGDLWRNIPGSNGRHKSRSLNILDSFSWAGGVSASQDISPGLIKTMSGSFKVPIDQIPGGGNICVSTQFYWVTHWVGIDGIAGLPHHLNKNGARANANLFQAGLSNKVGCTGAGATGIEFPYFFIEYWPDQPVTVVQGLKIAFDDTLSFLLTQIPATATKPPMGTWFMVDTTQGLGTMIPQNLAITPAAYPFLPNEAEAITEPPSCSSAPCGLASSFGSDDLSKVPRFLTPDWGDVTFTGLMVGLQDSGHSFPLMSMYKSSANNPADWYLPYQLAFKDINQDAGIALVVSGTELTTTYVKP